MCCGIICTIVVGERRSGKSKGIKVTVRHGNLSIFARVQDSGPGQLARCVLRIILTLACPSGFYSCLSLPLSTTKSGTVGHATTQPCQIPGKSPRLPGGRKGKGKNR